MMIIMFFGESPGLPASHAYGQDGNHVNSPSGNRNVAVDRLKTLAPKKLTCSRNVVDRGKTKIVTASIFPKGRACEAELWELRESIEEEFEEIGLKRNIRVHTGDKIVVQSLDRLVANIEGK